jgi:hypothetical protein
VAGEVRQRQSPSSLVCPGSLGRLVAVLCRLLRLEVNVGERSTRQVHVAAAVVFPMDAIAGREARDSTPVAA